MTTTAEDPTNGPTSGTIDEVGNDGARTVMTAATKRSWARLLIGISAVAIAVTAFTVMPHQVPTGSASTTSSVVPAPDLDEPAPAQPGSESVVLAGGCFWGVQGVFEHVKGVSKAESGYAGGDAGTASYEMVSTGATGHAESVRVTYDPAQVTLGQLLRIYFSVAHDPTQVGGQGADIGPQYRSMIVAQNPLQQRIADAYIAQLGRAAVYSAPIVTTVESNREFFPAEAYHQDYVNSHPTQSYVASAELPKLAELERQFPDLYRQQPALVFPDHP